MLIAGLAAALALRVVALPLVTTDTFHFLLPWQHHADAAGAGYLARPFTNYAPLYEHVLALLALLPGEALLRIKAASILFDVLLAAGVAACCPPPRRALGFVATLLLPTVILNSSGLGQSDALYAALQMLALAAALRGWPVWTMLAFSAALAAKLQAIFFVPVLGLLWLNGRQPLWTFALIPAVYVAAALPMLAAGRSFADTFGVYLGQFGTFHALASSAPNPWMIAQLAVDYHTGLAIGLPLAVVLVAAATFWLWQASILGRPGQSLTPEALLLCAAILMLLAPYVLPKMHDRYFYPLDPILITLTMVDRSYWRELALSQTASLLSYMPFLALAYGIAGPVFGYTALLAVVLMTAALVLLLGRAVRLARASGP